MESSDIYVGSIIHQISICVSYLIYFVLDAIEQEVSNINLVLENEIRVNIKRIAEGHIDLARNLYDTIKLSSELEVLSIKVTMHDSEIREIKQKIS